MTRSSGRIRAYVAMGILAVCGGLAGEQLARAVEPTRRVVASELAPAQRVLRAVSWEIRRLVADLLWVRIDGYIHESRPLPAAGGGFGVSYLTTLDLVPLYRLITLLDPTFIEAYSVAASQLMFGLNKHSEGISLLKEGIRRNPSDPRIKELHGQLGVYYLKDLQDPEHAIPHLEACRQLLLHHGERAEERRFVYHLPTVTGLLVLAYYRSGDQTQARRLFLEPHNLPEGHPVYRALEESAGRTPPPLPPRRPHRHVEHGEDPEHGVRHRPSEPHLRVWLEPERLSRIHATLVGAAAAALIVLITSLARRPTVGILLVALALGPALGLLRPQLPTLAGGWLLELFMLFTLGVALGLIVILRHLILRGQPLPVKSLERLHAYVDEALGAHASSARLFEVGVLCFEGGFFERALQVLSRIGPDTGALEGRALVYRILCLLRLSRLEEASDLYGRLDPAEIDGEQRDRITSALEEHGPLGRVKSVLLKVFLTDFAWLAGPQDPDSALVADARTGRLAPAHCWVGGVVDERYRELSLRAEGAEVLRLGAFDRELARAVELRLLRLRSATPTAAERFLATASSLGQISDRRVIKVYDVLRGRAPYYAVEAVDGFSLAGAADASAAGPGPRLRLLSQIVDLAADLASTVPAGSRIGLDDLLVTPGGTVMVTGLTPAPPAGAQGSARSGSPAGPGVPGPPVHWSVGLVRDAHSALLLCPVGGVPPYLATGLDLLVQLVGGSGAVADPVGTLSRTRSTVADLLRMLALSDAERERARVLGCVAWLDEVHRSKVHALKSKFAVCDRYRGAPEKLMRTFFRGVNIEEVVRLLQGLHSQVCDARVDLACVGEPLASVVGRLGATDFEAVARRIEGLARDTSDPGASIPFLESCRDLFRSLSLELGRLVESYEVDLVAVVREAAGRSPYASSVRLEAAAPGLRLRVARPERFGAELSVLLGDVLANAFEAQATSVRVEVGLAQGAPHVARIRLVDDGVGAPSDIMDRLSSRRVTTKEGGTATGLVAADQVVRAHGGTFQVVRQPGRGTEVSILFPLSGLSPGDTPWP